MSPQHKWILNRATILSPDRIHVHMLCSVDNCPASAWLAFGLNGITLTDPELFKKLQEPTQEHMKVVQEHIIG